MGVSTPPLGDLSGAGEASSAIAATFLWAKVSMVNWVMLGFLGFLNPYSARQFDEREFTSADQVSLVSSLIKSKYFISYKFTRSLKI